MISLSQVFKRYPQGRSSQAYSALSNISFTIQPGEMVFISGHSGAGKSTLLKLIAGIELPTAGSVIVNGQNVGKLKPAAMPFLRRNFGLVFQQHKLLFDRTVFADVVLPLEIA
ncbi:MAG: cell division ATP-binding protein FtsE, partial [Burkholderiales bacterium]